MSREFAAAPTFGVLEVPDVHVALGQFAQLLAVPIVQLCLLAAESMHAGQALVQAS